MKQRRQPWGQPPADAGGFTADLIAEIRAAAAALNQPVTFLRKNGDMYIAVRLPDGDEAKLIDAATDGPSELQQEIDHIDNNMV